MKKIFIFFALVLPFTVIAQINENFEDGNINGWTESSVGHWAASTDNPINGSYSLHHTFNQTVTGNYHDQISFPFSSFDINSETTTWRFQARYEYNPSGDNTWSFFLFADTDASEMFPASTVVNGYVLGVNYTNTDDLIKIWSVTGGSASILINTDYNWQGNITSSGTAGFEVKRTVSGDWSIYIDDNGGFDNLIQIGTTENDITHTTTNYLGFCHEYTVSADQKLWFDDLYLGSEIADEEAPQILSISAVSNNTIIVNFNENLLQSTAENVSNYSVDAGIGNPISASLNGTDNKQVELVFANNFSDETVYTLTVTGVEDLTGNTTVNEAGTFSYTHIAATSVYPISSTELDITFNKTVDILTAETLLNYSVNNGIEYPQTATIDGVDDKLMHLSFTNEFQPEQLYTLMVNNVEDTHGNVINPTSLDFSYYEVQPFDIVINEIMCDVNPAPEALPALEYLELYNHSAYDINLSGWTIEIEGYTVKNFPDSIIPAGQYAIICRLEFESNFAPFGMPIGITSFDLTTSGKRIILRNNNNTVIEDITYSDEWYDDDTKDGGGYSIERIDPLNFCGEDNNWTATNDVWGGTPGRINSVLGENPDNIAPELMNAQVLSSNYLLLEFDDNISYASGADILNFSVNNGIENPNLAFVDGTDRTLIHLFFSTEFTSDQENTLIVEGIKDNCGNTIQTTGYDFVYYLIYPVEVWAQDETKLKIKFSETVEISSGTNVSNYFADKGIGNPKFVTRDNLDTTVVYMLFTETFPDTKEVTLNVSGIKDINGNVIQETDLRFSYYTPQANDIAINEVLFYPNSGGNDFVEIYNRSGQRIDLVNVQLASYDKVITDSLVSLSPLSESNQYFEPETYLAFTESKDGVLQFYMSDEEENIIELASIPTFSSDCGAVVLLYKDTIVIDEFKYHEDMHFKLLDNEKGVSLERVNFNKPTQDVSNWHSASESVSFATPAYKNSQYSEGLEPGDAPVTVEPYIFSPGNDGFDDYAYINYKFQNPGNVATIIIFDAKGRQVRQLTNNLLLSTEGTIDWDGLYENNRIAPSGTYLIYFKVFDLNGNVNVYKIPVVSARRL